MSDKKYSIGEETMNGFADSNEELSVDDLVASLSRQISGLDEDTKTMDADTDQQQDELFDIFEDDKEIIENPDDLIQALQMAMEEAIPQDDSETEEEISENVDEVVPEEPAEVITDEPEEEIMDVFAEEVMDIPETEVPEESAEALVEEPVEEISEEIVDVPVEEAEEELPLETASGHKVLDFAAVVEADKAAEAVQGSKEPAAEEEAFDDPDPDISDVSEGVSGQPGVQTEVFPSLSLSPPPLSDRELVKEEKARLKAEKKQRKQEEKAKKKEEKKAKKKGGLKIFFSVLLLLIVAAAGVYLALSTRYKAVFYDGTKINGTDCTGLTVEETETIVSRQMDDYSMTLTFRDGKKETITGESIGFEYVPDGSVQEIKDSQIPILWLDAYLHEYSYTATAAARFDEAKMNDVMVSLPECNILGMEAPQDAHLEYSEETKKFEIIPEVQGNTLDLTALILIVEEEVAKGTTEIDVEELDLYQKPVRTSTDAELIKQQSEMNDAISASITYELPSGETQVLDADTLSTWVLRDEQGNLYIDPQNWGDHVAAYVDELALKVNTSDSQLAFNTYSGGTVVLANYLAGWLIDPEGEGQQLTEELAARAVVSREPVFAQRAHAYENNGIGNTYVEVDLSMQYLWAFENGALVLETPIVSGKMTPKTYTPEGIYPLAGKQAGRWLRGEQAADGSYEYESWVDYWMPFNGGIGLHDASWRGEFGGSIYYGGGSHGCVNMPTSKAGALFDWISYGTPVICYYSGGFTLMDGE